MSQFRWHFRGVALLATVFLICALIVLIYCIWTLDRGLDITDEAYYLLLAMYPESVKLYISAQQWITGGIWQATGSLVTFRAAGLTLLVVGSCLLGFGAITTVSQTELKFSNGAWGYAIVFSSAIICALIYVETINFSPSYNLLASAAAYFAAGLVLLALHSANKSVRMCLFILSGCVLGVEFVCKPSSGIATLCLIAVWILSLNPRLADKTVGFAVVLLSLLGSVYILTIINTTVPDAWTSIIYGFELFKMVQDEAVVARLGRYVVEFWGNFVHGVREHLYLILIVAMYFFIRRTVVVAIVAGILAYTLIYAKYHLGYSGQYELQFIPQMEFAFILLLLILLVSMMRWRNNRVFALLVGGLISLPYTVSVGTGNSIFTQIINCLAPWGVTVAIIANLQYREMPEKLLTLTLSMGFILAFSLQIVGGLYRAPYHMVKPMVEQNYSIHVASIGNMKVDAETTDFVKGIQKAANNCEIRSGAPFWGLYNVPGVAILIHGVPVLTPWINNIYQAETVLKKSSKDTVKASVLALLLDADGNAPPIPESLRFPMEYQYCGAAVFPLLIQEVQIWKHK